MKTVLNIKIDSEIKQEAQLLAAELGVPISIVVNAQLKEFLRTKKFSVSLDPILLPAVEKEIVARRADLPKTAMRVRSGAELRAKLGLS